MTNEAVDTLRSKIMRAVRRSNTGPEIRVRKLLHAEGFRFRLHNKRLPGTPDIVLARFKTVIFVHGCFWHRHPGCTKATMPKTRKEFWTNKFDQNVARDKKNEEKLIQGGWSVIVVWECETKDMDHLKIKLTSMLKRMEL